MPLLLLPLLRHYAMPYADAPLLLTLRRHADTPLAHAMIMLLMMRVQRARAKDALIQDASAAP